MRRALLALALALALASCNADPGQGGADAGAAAADACVHVQPIDGGPYFCTCGDILIDFEDDPSRVACVAP